MAKRMEFTQIGKGRLRFDAQEAFLEAQRFVDAKKMRATVNLKINIYPPNPKDPAFGEIDYDISITKPAQRSRRFATMLENGEITTDGGDPTDAMQIEAAMDAATTPTT